MKKQLINNLTKLVACQSVTGNQKEIKKALQIIDKELQQIFPFIKKEYEKNDVQSVVWLTKDTLKPDIILNAHVDVVPASKGMFKVKINNGKILGRGVSDMKFSIASFIEVVRELNKENKLKDLSLGIMITGDEEVGGFNGVGYLVNEIGYRPKLVIIPDGADNWKISEKAKGGCWVQLSTTGKSAHASKPWEGVSATEKLIDVLSWIKNKYPNPTKDIHVTSINIGKISGGTALNQVANQAQADLDIRYTKELTADEIITSINKKFPNVKTKKLLEKPFFGVDKNHPAIQRWVNLIKDIHDQKHPNENIFIAESGSADHHYFSEHGIPVLLSKPSGGLIHTEDEWLDEEDFYLYTKLLTKYVKEVISNS
ncbi:MAG: M20/M25/M40 family metallo-hydrolase [Candidatus Pacebacteria bacterium]|nr:M20/M25/M40 family metallo-hydrolase [Candidatus Paceibacterota bacterium]